MTGWSLSSPVLRLDTVGKGTHMNWLHTGATGTTVEWSQFVDKEAATITHDDRGVPATAVAFEEGASTCLELLTRSWQRPSGEIQPRGGNGAAAWTL
ncbi:hypothetical protein ACOMHN_065482 [Nucella lapillus]